MSKIDYNELVEFVRTHDEYYVAEFMFVDNKRISELEQDLEFTTKTANELIEIKHKLEQQLEEKNKEIKELKQNLTKKSQQIKKSKQTIKEKNSFGLALFATLYELLEEIDPENVSSRISFCTRQKKSLYDDTYKTIRNLQHRLEEKDKEIEDLSLQIANFNSKITQMEEQDMIFHNQLAIHELEKVKNLAVVLLEGFCHSIHYSQKEFRGHRYIEFYDLIRGIDNQIKELKGEQYDKK